MFTTWFNSPTSQNSKAMNIKDCWISIWFLNFIWFHMISTKNPPLRRVFVPHQKVKSLTHEDSPRAIETAFENHQGTLLGWNVNDSQPQSWMFSSHAPSELVEIESTVSICFTRVSYCRTCLCRNSFIKQYDFNMWIELKMLIMHGFWSFSPVLTYGCRQVDHLNFVSWKTPLDSKVTYISLYTYVGMPLWKTPREKKYDDPSGQCYLEGEKSIQAHIHISNDAETNRIRQCATPKPSLYLIKIHSCFKQNPSKKTDYFTIAPQITSSSLPAPPKERPANNFPHLIKWWFTNPNMFSINNN